MTFNMLWSVTSMIERVEYEFPVLMPACPWLVPDNQNGAVLFGMVSGAIPEPPRLRQGLRSSRYKTSLYVNRQMPLAEDTVFCKLL